MELTVTHPRRAPRLGPTRFLLCALVLLAAPRADAGTTAARPAPKAPRTLESITIEGDVAVPQVLFITARDVRRFRDGLGASYHKHPADVARSLTGPTRLRTTTSKEALKEEAP